MYHLIKKDFLIQKRNLKLSILLLLFFSVSFSSIGTTGLIYSICAVSYFLALGASALEEKNNSDMMLVSLPINKQKIVLSKYISVYVFTAYSILVIYGIVLMERLLKLPFNVLPFTIEAIVLAIAGVTFLCSIALPLIFKVGYLKAKMFNNILLFLLVFGTAALADNLVLTIHFTWQQKALQFFSKLSEIEMLGLIMIPLLIIFIFSYFLSLLFYKKREF
ncbi:ABC-2 transporter permease [Fictibacillus gelatini]|uniref:ABC-2 transporter permease n=1 Tax=Fictibacillus gelatini TaxID=225985 RepID=UPI0004015B24|nr:ABC-2 transporter permease [Fictibacillus gelatini]